MFYAYSTLDRADHLRKDERALVRLRSADTARLVPVWRGKSLVSALSDTHPTQAMLLAHDCAVPDKQTVFLGQEDGLSYFAVDVSELDEASLEQLAMRAKNRDEQSLPALFADLRSVGPVLPDKDGSLLAYARGLIYWNDCTRFCTRCGHSLMTSNGGHIRQCCNESCGHLVFPRTDPAVIMLVSYTPEDGGQPVCLLGRSPNFPAGVYSTLAGFVEPGESLEQAVQREVKEEASIDTHEVRYVSSQPWPFPRSIMLGFEATALSTDIICDPTEIEDAKWFTREQLKTFGNWGDETPGYKLPRVDSISRLLIDRWLQQSS
ncbi:MAG: NAD(+) diphosphatase [Granulosicoccus sp.]